MKINCEKCGTIATGLTRLLAKHQQREHVLNHRRVRVGVIVTVDDDDSFGTCPPGAAPMVHGGRHGIGDRS